MSFECKHCGQCCTDECTQINLSLADVKRLCSFLNCDVSGVLDKIGWRPFEDPEDPGTFDVELGLRLPCGFRKDGRCSVYPARPLNCRMFPSVFLGNVPDDQLHEVIDATHKCVVAGIELTDEEKEKYREYAHHVGELILSEAEETEDWYAENGGRRRISVADFGYGPDVMQGREETVRRVRAAMQKIGDDAVDAEKLKKGIARLEPEDIPDTD